MGIRVSWAISACKEKELTQACRGYCRVYLASHSRRPTTRRTASPHAGLRSRCCCVPRSLFSTPEHTLGPGSRRCCLPRPLFGTTEHTLVPRRWKRQLLLFFARTKAQETCNPHPDQRYPPRASPCRSVPFQLVTTTGETLGPRSRCCCRRRIGRHAWRERELERQLRNKRS